MAVKIIMTLDGTKSAVKFGRNGIRGIYQIRHAAPVMETCLKHAPIPVHENGINNK